MRHVLSVDNDYLILDNPIIELGDRSPLSNHKGEIMGQSLFVKTKIDDITLERLATFDDIGKEAKQLGYILVPYTEEQEVQEVQEVQEEPVDTSNIIELESIFDSYDDLEDTLKEGNIQFP